MITIFNQLISRIRSYLAPPVKYQKITVNKSVQYYPVINQEFLIKTNNHLPITNFVSQKPVIKLNTYEVPLRQVYSKKINLDKTYIVRKIAVPTSRIGKKIIFKIQVNDKVKYRINNVIINDEEYQKYIDYLNLNAQLTREKKKKMRMYKNSDYYHYNDLRKVYKHVDKKLNKARKMKSRQFVSMGETMFFLEVIKDNISFYVSLVHHSILQRYYDNNFFRKKDKIIKILEQQYDSISQKVLNNRIIDINEFINMISKEDKLVFIAANKQMLDMIYDLALECEISVFRKMRNLTVACEIKLLQWPIEVGIVFRNELSTYYKYKIFKLDYGQLDIMKLASKLMIVQTINDYNYIMILLQYMIGVQNLYMTATNNINAVNQINSVIMKYKKIVTHSIMQDIQQHYPITTNVYAQILKQEKFYVDMFILINKCHSLPFDFLSRHKRGIHLKKQLVDNKIYTNYEFEQIFNNEKQIGEEIIKMYQ